MENVSYSLLKNFMYFTFSNVELNCKVVFFLFFHRIVDNHEMAKQKLGELCELVKTTFNLIRENIGVLIVHCIFVVIPAYFAHRFVQ